MRYGGENQYGGYTQYGGQPYGADMSYCITRMVNSLSGLKKENGGLLHTVDVFTGTEENISLMLHAGTPAILVGYTGGTFAAMNTGGTIFSQTLQFTVLCIASNLCDRGQRLHGRNAYEPGLWNLTRWAAHIIGNEMLHMEMLENPRPVSERFDRYDAEFFIGTVVFEAESHMDVLDSATLTKFTTLGYVHNPSDLEKLFEDDNQTANTDDPTSQYGPPVIPIQEQTQ